MLCTETIKVQTCRSWEQKLSVTRVCVVFEQHQVGKGKWQGIQPTSTEESSPRRNSHVSFAFFSMTDQLVPEECAIKVFKTTLVDFKNRAQYVKGDLRFFKDDFKKHNPRRIIKIWAEKEDHNLRR